MLQTYSCARVRLDKHLMHDLTLDSATSLNTSTQHEEPGLPRVWPLRSSAARPPPSSIGPFEVHPDSCKSRNPNQLRHCVPPEAHIDIVSVGERMLSWQLLSGLSRRAALRRYPAGKCRWAPDTRYLGRDSMARRRLVSWADLRVFVVG